MSAIKAQEKAVQPLVFKSPPGQLSPFCVCVQSWLASNSLCKYNQRWPWTPDPLPPECQYYRLEPPHLVYWRLGTEPRMNILPRKLTAPLHQKYQTTGETQPEDLQPPEALLSQARHQGRESPPVLDCATGLRRPLSTVASSFREFSKMLNHALQQASQSQKIGLRWPVYHARETLSLQSHSLLNPLRVLPGWFSKVKPACKNSVFLFSI